MRYNTLPLFTFMLPYLVINFFLNNQPDALIIQTLFCYKNLHVSGNLSAHHQEFSTVSSALVSFVQFVDERFQAEFCSSILTLLGSGHQQNARNLPVPNLQYRTPDDGQRGCPKHVVFYNRIKFG
jgi:hypothetical protein